MKRPRSSSGGHEFWRGEGDFLAIRLEPALRPPKQSHQHARITAQPRRIRSKLESSN